MKVEEKKVETQATTTVIQEWKNSYSDEALHMAWTAFAEKRKMYQAEYQLLTMPYERQTDLITILLHNPIQETILSTFKSELTVFLRDQLKNSSINVTSELREEESKKVMYTPREKFQFLVEKNPLVKELKERLGLDTDF